MRKLIVLISALAMVLGFAGIANADKPEETGNQNRPCVNVADHPLCVDGEFLPPGLGGPNPGCDNAKEGKNPNCEEPEEPTPTECPPATGPVTGIGQQVADGIRDGGGGQLSDVLEQILCGVQGATGL